MEDNKGKIEGKLDGEQELTGFNKWYHASKDNKLKHRARCDKWREGHIEHNRKTQNEYNKKRYKEKILKTYNYNCVECGKAYVTHKKRNIICNNPECKRKHQYKLWKKWADDNGDRRREIARESARRKKTNE